MTQSCTVYTWLPLPVLHAFICCCVLIINVIKILFKILFRQAELATTKLSCYTAATGRPVVFDSRMFEFLLLDFSVLKFFLHWRLYLPLVRVGLAWPRQVILVLVLVLYSQPFEHAYKYYTVKHYILAAS